MKARTLYAFWAMVTHPRVDRHHCPDWFGCRNPREFGITRPVTGSRGSTSPVLAGWHQSAHSRDNGSPLDDIVDERWCRPAYVTADEGDMARTQDGRRREVPGAHPVRPARPLVHPHDVGRSALGGMDVSLRQ